ncbi:glycosyltransferase [Vibrio sp. TRT 21S02]|uniref:glycosyltransferase family 2 protein n=1 Tax=Vibrio sp. TRT 21S02 TaxID=3418507 RepID=UPI003CEA4D0A
MELSVVTTLYKSENYINDFYKRITKECNELTSHYEIIFVDDGSPDNSLEMAISIAQGDDKVKVIELSRNFGHHKAIMTGLKESVGDLVFLIDSDLEEEPELLSKFYHCLHEGNGSFDVVYGTQVSRKGGWFERVSGHAYYNVLNKFTDLEIDKNIVTARLMNRAYVNALVEHQEKELFLAGLWCITGFRQKPISIIKHSTSDTTYTLFSKLQILENSIVSFSSKPLKLIFHIGVLISLFSLFYIAYLISGKLFFYKPIDGWTSIIASIWLLGGLIILFIGVIGIYLSKIFIETKQRPYTVIRKTYGGK